MYQKNTFALITSFNFEIPTEKIVESIYYYGSPNVWSEDKIEIHEPDGTIRKPTKEELDDHYNFIRNKIGSGGYHG